MSYIASPDHGSQYLLFRPSPPQKMISRILDYLGNHRDLAVDVGCGSGQNTFLLAPYFKQVIAVDSDPEQIKNARKVLRDIKTIQFQVCSAEKLPVNEGTVDLITGVQSVHWFDVESFYREVERAMKPGGVLAISGYRLPIASTLTTHFNITPHIVELFNITFGECVLSGSRMTYIDNYSDERFIKAPFSSQPFTREDFETEPRETDLENLLGYIRTWSTYQQYVKKYGLSAAEEAIYNFSSKIPTGEKLSIVFSYFLLLCKKE